MQLDVLSLLTSSHAPNACLRRTLVNTISKRCVWYRERSTDYRILTFPNTVLCSLQTLILTVQKTIRWNTHFVRSEHLQHVGKLKNRRKLFVLTILPWNFDRNCPLLKILVKTQSFEDLLRSHHQGRYNKEPNVTDIQFGTQLCRSPFHSFLQHLKPQSWVPNCTYYLHIWNGSRIHSITRASSYYTKCLWPPNEISAADPHVSV